MSIGSAHASIQLIQQSIHRSIALVGSAALALASIPLGAAEAEGTKLTQAHCN